MGRNFKNIIKLLMLPVGLFLIFSIIAPGFGFHSIPVILSQSIVAVVIGFGLSLLMNAELMDFSMGARTVFAAILGGILSQSMGIPGLLLGCLAGALFGALLMAILYQYLKIPVMVVSLGIVMIYEVLGAKLTGSSGYLRIDSEIYKIGSYPNNIIILVLSGVLCYVLYYKMKIGCHITAVGNDERMCKNVGIKAAKVKFTAIMLTGLFCAIAAVLTICYSGAITASTGMGTMGVIFKPIMCVIIGRQMRKTLDNMPLLILIGGLCISIIFNGFIAIGLPDALQDIVLGVFLIAVMGYSSNSEKVSNLYRRLIPAK
jgi:ribose transport system permease protein